MQQPTRLCWRNGERPTVPCDGAWLNSHGGDSTLFIERRLRRWTPPTDCKNSSCYDHYTSQKHRRLQPIRLKPGTRVATMCNFHFTNPCECSQKAHELPQNMLKITCPEPLLCWRYDRPTSMPTAQQPGETPCCEMRGHGLCVSQTLTDVRRPLLGPIMAVTAEAATTGPTGKNRMPKQTW